MENRSKISWKIGIPGPLLKRTRPVMPGPWIQSIRILCPAIHRRMPLADFSWKEVGAALLESGWELPLPLVVLGGIYSGLLAVSEAAAVTAVYVVLVEVIIRREIPLKKLPGIMRESMVLVGGILLILGASLASTNYVIDAEVPQKLIGIVTSFVDGRISFLFLLLLLGSKVGYGNEKGE